MIAPPVFYWLEDGLTSAAVAELSEVVNAGRRIVVGSPDLLLPRDPETLALYRQLCTLERCEEEDAAFVFRVIVEHDPKRAIGKTGFGARSAQVLRTCESPIESRMALHLLDRLGEEREVCAQVNVETDAGPFRLDLAVIEEGTEMSRPFRIAIECDGHDFHEKTPEQAQHDKRRDRVLTLAGWRVLRFTGREVVRDPVARVDEVEALADYLAFGNR